MYNKAFLIGRLVKDPEMRMTTSGIPITRFRIAVDRVRGKNTEEKTTDFINIVTWRRLAEICGQFLKKGKLIAIEGRLQIETFEKDGEKKVMAEVVADNMQMLDRLNQPVEINEPILSND